MYRVNQYRAPEPKPPSKTPVIVGAVLAFVGASTLASAALLLRTHHTVRAAAPATSESAKPTSHAPAMQAPVASASANLEDEPEPVPAAPGTPRSSEHARPKWAKDASYAPQLTDPLDVFLAASPLRGDVAHALVICRFQSFNKMDTFAGDDLRASLVLDGTPGRSANGPEDANLAFVSAPLAKVAHGDMIRFEVWDRDVFSDELITRTSVKYDAGPVVMSDTGASIECRALDGAALDREVKEHGARADRDARTLAGAKLDGRRPLWGWPTSDLTKQQGRAGDLAALVGWDDPRTVKRVVGLASAEAVLEAKRERLFGELHAAAKADADVHGLHVHLEEIACGARKAALGVASATSPCVARVTLRNDTDGVISFTPYSAPQPYLATAKTGPLWARFDKLVAPELASKATAEALVIPEGVALEDEPALLGVCIAATCATVLAR